MSTYIESGFVGVEYPMTHPRICWNSIAPRAVISATTEAAGFAAVNAASPFTHSFWSPTAVPASYTMNLSAAEQIAYVGLAGHDLASVGGDLVVELFVSGLWVTVSATIAPDTDADMVVLFDRRLATAVRITFDTAVPRVAAIAAGDVIEVPQAVYSGVSTPVDLSNETEFMINRTVRNSYVGKSIKRQRKINEFPISNVRETWVRTVLAPFIEDAVSRPFFLAERPDGYPDAVSYRWLDRDIRPERTGQANLMRFTL